MRTTVKSHQRWLTPRTGLLGRSPPPQYLLSLGLRPGLTAGAPESLSGGEPAHRAWGSGSRGALESKREQDAGVPSLRPRSRSRCLLRPQPRHSCRQRWRRRPASSPRAAVTAPPPFPGWLRGEVPRPGLLPVVPRWRTQWAGVAPVGLRRPWGWTVGKAPQSGQKSVA